MTHEPRDFNRLLDRALANYSASEPRSGLEDRILARIADAAETRPAWGPPRTWIWLAAASVAAFILIGAHYFGATKPATEVVLTPPPVPEVVHPTPARPVIRVAAPIRPAHAMRRTPAPPAPLRLTPQERLFARFVLDHPRDAARWASSQAAPPAPLADSPIAIEPIRDVPIDLVPIDADPAQQPSS